MSHQSIDMIMMKFEKKSNLPASTSLPIIVENYSNINTLIDKMHNNILVVFKKREDELLNNYKTEMIKAQLALKDLSESTSENELRRRMIQKKEELEQERQLYIQQSIEYANRCKDLKVTLSEVIANTKDLEGEIKFLDEQLVYADKHNQTLQEQTIHLNEDKNDQLIQLKLQTNQYPIMTTNRPDLLRQNNKVTSYAQMKVMRDIQAPKLQSKSLQRHTMRKDQLIVELEKQNEINSKLIKMLDNSCFQETLFERNFNQAVQSVQILKEKQSERQSELQRKGPKILPQLVPDDKQNGSQITDNSTIDFTTLETDNFNEQYKRKIFEEFLEKDGIKKIIYELLFHKEAKIDS